MDEWGVGPIEQNAAFAEIRTMGEFQGCRLDLEKFPLYSSILNSRDGGVTGCPSVRHASVTALSR